MPDSVWVGAFTRAGGNNSGIGIRDLVVKRVIAVVGIVAVAHASIRSASGIQVSVSSDRRWKVTVKDLHPTHRLDRELLAVIIQRVRWLGRIGPGSILCHQSIHHRKFDRCSGRQIMNGQQHVFCGSLDIGIACR